MALTDSVCRERSEGIGFDRSNFRDVAVSLDPVARDDHQLTRLVQQALALDQRRSRDATLGLEQLAPSSEDFVFGRRVRRVLSYGHPSHCGSKSSPLVVGATHSIA